MPATYNGIGTTYYGNRNRTTHFGFCNQCKRELMLTDYETTLWFCVFYVPLIPLGKKQIVNECPGCTYHYAVPLGEWQKQGDEAVGQISELLATDTSDPDKVMEMHATLSSYHRHEEAMGLAGVMLAKFGEHSELLFYLASWHEHFTRFKEADALFVKASDVAPQDMDKLAASVFALARQSELDLALARMEKLDPPAIPNRIPLVRHVARQLAARGRPSDAYRLLAALLNAAPQLKSAQDFQAEIRPLEKKLRITQSIVPAESIWRRPITKFVAAASAAVIAFAAIEGWNWYVMTHAPIHAVSGVNVPIEFSVDGGPTRTIPAQGRISFTLPEGRHRISLVKPPLPGADPFDIEVSQSWFSRFLSKPGFVIDPSRTAVVVHSRVRYSEVAMPGDASQDSIHVAEPWTQYSHVDYRFEAFPEHVEGNKTEIIYRTGLELIPGDPLSFKGYTTLAAAIAAEQRRLLVDPGDDAELEYLGSIMMSEGKVTELADFVRTHLGDDPPLITWHRVHQNLATDKQALVAEYDRLLEAHPQNAAYLYLRGRICESGKQANEFYDRAIAADADCLFAYIAKALEWKSRAKYVEAAEIFATAWDRLHSTGSGKLKPQEVNYFRSRIGNERLESLIAAGNYDEFDAIERALRGQSGGGEENPLVYLSVLRKGNPDALVQYRGTISARLARLAPRSQLLFAQLRLTNAMYEGDLVAMREAATQMPEPPRQQLLEAIAFDEGGDPECKTVLGTTNKMLPILQKLLTSLRYRELGKPFDASRAEAIALMKAGDGSTKALAELFQQSPAVAIEEVDDISLQERERGIILIALAQENPAQKEEMLRYAKRLLVIPDLPQKCLDDWIKHGLGE